MLEAEHFTMVPNSEGRLELVAVAYRDSTSPEAIWHATQTPVGGDIAWFGKWSQWRSLGKPGGQLVSGIRPAVGVNTDGRLEVAVVGTEVFHAWQRPDGDWSDWRSLGTPPASGSSIGGSTLASNQDGRLELFTQADDGTLWHRWQAEPVPGPWREWGSLESPGGHGFGILQTSPSLASNIDGRLELFVLAGDGAVWHRWQKVPNGGWSSWDSLDTPLSFDKTASLSHELEVVRNHDGRLELFAQDFNGVVWHRWQTRAGGGPWAAWGSLGGVEHVRHKAVAGTHPDGRLLLFAVTNHDELEIRRQEQTARNNGWLPEWKSEVRLSETTTSSTSSITRLSSLALTSESIRGRPLLCSVARGTGGFAGQRTPLILVGHLPHSDRMTFGLSFLDKPPEEP